MSVRAEFAIGTDGLVLAETLQSFPGVKLEVGQVARTREGALKCDLWVTGVETEAFIQELGGDSTVRSANRLSEDGSWTLLSTQVVGDDVRSLYAALIELDGQLLSATCEGNQWFVSFRFPDRDALGRFEEQLRNTEPAVAVESVDSGGNKRGEPDPDGAEPLSDEQQEALQVALRAGYFTVPRRANLGDVADELGISGQAASERLRRGLVQLVETQVGEQTRKH
ncbi:helix-turn-helix domain-containing protein [Haloarchaeobius sp. HME9146]|uniref:helix-turn-helix domain-containing protein n=1 Tax=Haloarchaeobius sp. HME9146 TaxID=2978732 RepID=UPI0021BF0489|nr:helix-turn-helix domain-containing protein [Haloarchaeobius sp. HME9146]MCT9095723.1 helix-turn-helix domain-containing protein [Haloarchaeobius sp. HME9146]